MKKLLVLAMNMLTNFSLAPLQAALDIQFDVAMIPVPARKHNRLHLLDQTGLPFLVADVLVYSECDLQRSQPNALRSADLEFEMIDPGRLEVLDRLVAEDPTPGGV
jgi:hypothetical protein